MKKTILSLGLTAAVVALSATSVKAETLKFMSGSSGGSWFPMAGAISTALKSVDGELAVQVLPGNGVQNVVGVGSGKAHIGLSNAITTVEGLQGSGPFAASFDNLCNVGALYPQYLQIVTTKTDADDLADLKGTAMATLRPGSTSEAVFGVMSGLSGLSQDDFSKINYGSGSDQVSMIKDGQADSTFLVTAAPSGLITDIANSRSVKLLNVSGEMVGQLQAQNPGYGKLSIPAGTYEGQTEDVSTVGFPLHVIVDCSMDDKIAYSLAKAIYENRADLGAVNKFMTKATLADVSKDVGVPTHAGAKKYFAEQK